MKKLLFLSSLTLTLCGFSATGQTSGQSQSYGASFSQQKVMSVARVPVLMKDKQKLENFQMEGYIAEVCQEEGCWMIMRSDNHTTDNILVKMKDHAFVMPKDIAGKRAIVQGTVVKKTQTVAEQKHYLEDAHASAEALAKVTAPKEIFEMQVTGVVLYK